MKAISVESGIKSSIKTIAERMGGKEVKAVNKDNIFRRFDIKGRR